MTKDAVGGACVAAAVVVTAGGVLTKADSAGGTHDALDAGDQLDPRNDVAAYNLAVAFADAPRRRGDH